MASKDRLAFYSTFLKSHSLADYLFTVKKAVLRKHLLRFRLSVSPLKTHRLRYSERTQDIFTCPFCDTNESEIHFLLVCPKYKTLRETYFPSKFYNRPSAFKVAILSADTRLSFPLAIYISKAFELRANSISNAILAWSGIVSHMLLYCCLLLSLIFVLPRALACVYIYLCVCVCVCARARVGCACVWVCTHTHTLTVTETEYWY